MVRLSGIKPTGKIHLGNYFGAIKQYIEKQDAKENIYFVANYHALTTTPKREELLTNTINIVLDYLAFGLDPNKNIIFVQSDVPEHTLLANILSNVTPFGLLNRAHAFKSKIDKEEDINVGLFSYPVLMAADILMYDTNLVPVGRDQKQHIEIARDIAIKFNNIYGNVFTLPEAEIVENFETVKGINGQKMSKSYNNTIEIFSSEKEIKKQVFSIVTDSKSIEEAKDPDQCNIFNIYKLFVDEKEQNKLRIRYSNGIGYGELKKALYEHILDYMEPFRKRREELLKNMDYVKAVLKEGSIKAREKAKSKIEQVERAVGLIR